MAGEWPRVRIGDVAEVFDGPHATPKKTDSGPIFLGITSLKSGRLDLSTVEHISEEDFAKWTRRVTPRAGDVVFSYETKLGEAAQIPDGLRCCLGRRMGLVRANGERLDSRFFLYQYLGPAFQAFLHSRTIHGSTVDRIPLVDFPDFPIALPPIGEQRAIGHILGTLDDKIELNRRMNETLEAMARAIFKSWFVDFDPVRAKASGEPPESICRRLGLTPELLALFPNRLVDSELGEIPEGWDLSPLPEAFEINPTRTLRKGALAPYLDMANMPTTAARALAHIQREFGSGTKYMNGDTLVARITPCLENGKTCYVDFLEENQVGWGSTEYIVLRPKPPLPSEFAYFLARTDAFRNHAIANMTGTSGRQRVPASAFDGFYITVPTPEIAGEFGRFSAAVIAKMRGNDEESRLAAEHRDTLLPKLLSGELRVPAANAAMEATA